MTMTRTALFASLSLGMLAFSGAAQAQTKYELPCYHGADYVMTIYRDGSKTPSVTSVPEYKRAQCREMTTGDPTGYFLEGYPIGKSFTSPDDIRQQMIRIVRSIDDGIYSLMPDDKLPPAVAFVKRHLDEEKAAKTKTGTSMLDQKK